MPEKTQKDPEAHEADENALMAAYATGDLLAGQQLSRTLRPYLLKQIKRLFNGTVDPEDVVQSAFLRLHQRRDSYQIGRPVRAWMLTISKHVALDEMRHRCRRPELLVTASMVERLQDRYDPSKAEKAVGQLSTRRAVLAAVAELNDQHRAVIDSRLLGHTYGEIGEQIGTTPEAAKLRGFRAYACLRERLAALAPATCAG